MAHLDFLYELFLIFAVALPVVALLQKIQVPSIAGFLLSGALIGPGALGLVSKVERVEVLAEVGVVLLLFGIGLELSLERIRRLWKPILVGGALQVGLTIGVAALAARIYGYSVQASVFIGCLVCLSSTAIVLRGLSARGEIDAPHGRFTLGILVFQDLSVVPMMLVLPLLAGGSEATLGGALLALGKAAGLLALVLGMAAFLVPKILAFVAATRQRDLFVLTVFLTCIGTALVASTAGVSLALGAFLGGLVVSGSDYRHQALVDLIPFREVFASVFFVSVGMLLDPQVFVGQSGLIALVLVSVIVGKFLVVLLTGAILRLPLRVSVLSGVALCQVGEFSFVLVRSFGASGLVDRGMLDVIGATTILSMLVTPWALAVAPHIAAGALRVRVLTRLLDVRATSEAADSRAPLRDHVIIAGWGITGQGVARALQHCGVPYVIVDLNPENVRMAMASGEPAYFGDVSSSEVLEHLHAAEAREVIIAVNDPDAATRSLDAVRRIAPRVRVLVRGRYISDVAVLRHAGATEVVTAEVEAAAEIARRVLVNHGVDEALIEAELRQIRAAGVVRRGQTERLTVA